MSTGSAAVLDRLGLTGPEAAAVLAKLLEASKLRPADVEAALAAVRGGTAAAGAAGGLAGSATGGRGAATASAAASKRGGGGLFGGFRLRGSGRGDKEEPEAPTPQPSPPARKAPPASLAESTRTKTRQKVQAQRVDVFGSGDGKSVAIPNYPKTPEAVAFLTEALRSDTNVLFSSLSDAELQKLIGAMAAHKVVADTVIIRQGDIGDYFYILQSGRVDFLVDGTPVGNCGPGAGFGELALLYDSPRAATCVAADDCALFRVDQNTFRYLLARTQAGRDEEVQRILRKVPFLSELEDQALSRIVDALSAETYGKDQSIFRKGEVGDRFYILEQGTARIHDIGFGDTKFDDIDLQPGAYFGERALLTGEPRAAHVTATSDNCVCLALSREAFEATLGPLQALMDRAMTKRVLLSIPSFREEYIANHELDRLLDSMKEVAYKKGQIIMEEGTPVKPALHIIRTGKVTVVSNKGEINNLTSGGHFGESTLTMAATDKAPATISAIEDVVCHVMTRADVEKVVGSVTRLGKPRALINARDRKDYVDYKNLKKIRILGMGAFGKVWLVVDQKTDKTFALKLMNKRQCIEYGQHEGVIREKNILANIDHPFLLKMWGSYQDDRNVMMLLSLIQGGELFSVLHSDKGDGVSNADAVFYGACVLEGLGHLHERNICYRDLKPENALIDADGYCIIVDYGFAKVVTNKTFTLCGTPEYLAPELILSKGHNKGVDYWAFGVLIYEMLIGRSPFYDHDQMRLFKKIVQGKYSYPSRLMVSKAAEDLIAALLQRKQSTRLGSLKGGHVDVQNHPWFKDMNLEKLLKRELKAPWKPTIKNALDASNFEDFSKQEKETDTGAKLSAKEQSLFKEFGEYV